MGNVPFVVVVFLKHVEAFQGDPFKTFIDCHPWSTWSPQREEAGHFPGRFFRCHHHIFASCCVCIHSIQKRVQCQKKDITVTMEKGRLCLCEGIFGIVNLQSVFWGEKKWGVEVYEFHFYKQK